MASSADVHEQVSQLEHMVKETGSAVAHVNEMTSQQEELKKNLDDLIKDFSEQVITEEFSDKLNLYVKNTYRDELENFEGDEKELRDFKESLFNRAFDELGLIEKAEAELTAAGVPAIHERLEVLECDTDKVNHMFNDCYTLMEAIETNLSTLQSRLPPGTINYVPYSTEINPIVVDDDDKVDLDEADDDDEVVAISPEERVRPISGARDVPQELPRKILTPHEVMEEVVVSESTPILARRGEIWHNGRVTEIITPSARPEDTVAGSTAAAIAAARRFRVKFESSSSTSRTVAGSEIAFRASAALRNEVYPVGTRVVSVYRDDEGAEDYYSGIVAEPPSERNSKRYLLFFDDGYTQYSKEDEIYRIFLQTTRNWMELSDDSQEFVKKYLENYPNRPMVRLKPSMTVRTELNCRWLPATVEEVDASLVLIRFNCDNHREWIYRGSTRLEPLYSEIRKSLTAQKAKPHAQRKLDSGASNKPVVEYLHDKQKPQRPTARKSTVPPLPVTRRLNQPIDSTYVNFADRDQNSVFVQDNMAEEIENRGSIVSTVSSLQRTQPTFVPHECSSKCLGEKGDSRDTYKGWNPLEIPILWNWARSRVRAFPRCGGRDNIVYVAPCGRRLRSMTEVERYLADTNSQLTVDLFCYDSSIRINAEFKVYRAFTNIGDLSYGAENVPVPCVNSVDNEVPPYVDYHRDRISRHTPLCEEPVFLPGCECEDNCRDKSKCFCRQLTISMSACRRGGTVDVRSGYAHRRLLHHYVTGVFECNANCGCDSRCQNRVVQNGLWAKLQIFKTEKKGWGIRTLHDIPKGMFICIYAGMMYGEQLAVDEGNEFGDEYQADLDYIECVENGKEGYESDVEDPSDEEEQPNNGQAEVSSPSSASEESDSGAEVDYRSSRGGPGSERRTLPQRNAKEKLRSRAQEAAEADRRAAIKETAAKKSSAGARAYIGRLVPSPTKGADGKETAVVIVISDEEDTTEQETNKEKKRTGGRRSTRGGGGLSSSAGTKCPSPDSDKAPPAKFKPLRELYGDGHTQPYIMDAKKAGNLGRYMNHSCCPNAFVQNVFINTHDARFPEVAFFACKNIMAGEELTWDYQYQVGSVPNKELYCYCGTAECRGRLL